MLNHIFCPNRLVLTCGGRSIQAHQAKRPLSPTFTLTLAKPTAISLTQQETVVSRDG
jgi:hypothetical protein